MIARFLGILLMVLGLAGGLTATSALAGGVLPATRGGTGATDIPDCPRALGYVKATHTFFCNGAVATTTSTVVTTSTTAST